PRQCNPRADGERPVLLDAAARPARQPPSAAARRPGVCRSSSARRLRDRRLGPRPASPARALHSRAPLSLAKGSAVVSGARWLTRPATRLRLAYGRSFVPESALAARSAALRTTPGGPRTATSREVVPHSPARTALATRRV